MVASAVSNPLPFPSHLLSSSVPPLACLPSPQTASIPWVELVNNGEKTVEYHQNHIQVSMLSWQLNQQRRLDVFASFPHSPHATGLCPAGCSGKILQNVQGTSTSIILPFSSSPSTTLSTCPFPLSSSPSLCVPPASCSMGHSVTSYLNLAWTASSHG